MEWEKDAYSYLLINLFNGIALFASKVALSGYQFAKGNMVASIWVTPECVMQKMGWANLAKVLPKPKMEN